MAVRMKKTVRMTRDCIKHLFPDQASDDIAKVKEPDSDESTPGDMHNGRACLILTDDPVKGLGVSERVAKKHGEVLKKDHNDVELEISSVDGEVRNDGPLLQEALEAGFRLREEDAVVGKLLRIVVEFLAPEHFG
ncbi:hypothetical protein HG530_010323 [Fusarium avenaceum]|nr:hypothetical protein HG530_010323 [Fusarium avenaceum]